MPTYKIAWFWSTVFRDVQIQCLHACPPAYRVAGVMARRVGCRGGRDDFSASAGTWNTASVHVRFKTTAVSCAERVAAVVRPNTRQEIARWQRTRASADRDDAMRMIRTCVNPNTVARVMQHCTHSDPWRAPRGQTFAEGHHGAERYRHAFSVTMAAFKQAAQALPKTPSRQSLRRPYCGTERQLIGTCTTGTFFGTNDGHGS